MNDGALWIVAIGGALGGIAVLRAAWARATRSPMLTVAGWGLLAVSTLAGGMLGGAWGVAAAWMAAMAAALVVMAHAAATSSASARASSSSRKAGIAPPGEPLHLGRRALTFVIVVPLALASSIAFAVGLRAALVLVGTGEADANAVGLFAVPLAWGILASVVLMRERRGAQIATLSFCALAVLVGLVPGT